MKKLPEKLYHFTSMRHFEFIVRSGVIKLSPSNLRMDDDTLHSEPIIIDGEIVGTQYVDKYKNHHPVVWLTSNPDAPADGTGLSADKTEVRISFDTANCGVTFLKWTDFLKKYNGKPEYYTRLKKNGGSDWKNWYVCETEIPFDSAKDIRVPKFFG